MKALTIGTFDLLHFEHINFLQRACRLGKGNLTVGINSDEFVKTFKSPVVMSLSERMYALEQQGYITAVNDSPGRKLIERIRPDILIVGSDWAVKDYYQQIDVTQDWLDELQITVAYIPRVTHTPLSSTEIKHRILNQRHDR